MIFQTPILSLLLISALSSLTLIWAAAFGLRVLRRWDTASGGQSQIAMERKTQLFSTLLWFVMLAQSVALALFVFNADRMTPLFVGAMCAVGTLNANGWGFPALYAKIALFFAAALWLMLDRADRLGADFPLTRVKYAAIIGIAALMLIAFGLELAYFLNLRTDVITSCCSRLFTPANDDLAADLSAVRPGLALGLLAGAGAAVALSGAWVLWRGRGQALFATVGSVTFFVALMAIVSVVSSYVYDHPNHHCPFCLLKREYGYFGWALYVPLFLGTAFALGAGTLAPAAGTPSLRTALPPVLRRQVMLSLAGFALFGMAVIWAILRSDLILFPG